MSQAQAALLVAVASLLATLLAMLADQLRDRRSRRAKSPQWTTWPTTGWSMVDREDRARHPPKVGLVERPTVTRLALWNAGFVTIHAGDASPSAPFRIAGHSNAPVLGVKLVRCNSPGSRLRVSENAAGEWEIVFEYLRPGIGGLFNIVHAGESEYAVRVEGELVDGNELKRTSFPLLAWHGFMPKFIRRVIGDQWAHRLFILCEVFTSYFVVYLLFFDETVLSFPSDSAVLFWIAVSFQTILQTLINLFFLQGWRVKVPASLRPFDQSDSV